MREIELDGRKMDDRSSLFAHLKAELGLPDYFGNNLDALADCLGEMSDVSILFAYPGAAINSLGDYGRRLIQVFENEAGARKDFRLRLLK